MGVFKKWHKVSTDPVPWEVPFWDSGVQSQS